MTEASKVSLIRILIEVGFKPKQQSLIYNFGKLNIFASQGVNERLQDCFLFMGSYIGKNSAIELEFSLPLEVESYEIGLALIAYHFKRAGMEPMPEWLKTGLSLQHMLPWEKERIAYNAAPKALIEYEWYRLLIKKLRKKAEEAEDSHISIFSYEKGVLKVVLGNEVIAILGSGNDWETEAKIKTKSLIILPKRISSRDGLVYIWKAELNIDRCRFETL